MKYGRNAKMGKILNARIGCGARSAPSEAERILFADDCSFWCVRKLLPTLRS